MILSAKLLLIERSINTNLVRIFINNYKAELKNSIGLEEIKKEVRKG